MDLGNRACYGCCSVIKEGEVCLRCPKCGKFFCQTCDAFIHDNIFHCPGCLARELRVCLKRVGCNVACEVVNFYASPSTYF